MIIESMPAPTSDIDARAARHAALGEPTRLRIVDALAMGDLSPREMQAVLGTSSNLLAHHLRVLEECGLIERTPSAGDRRRHYVRLRHDRLHALASRPAPTASRVVFVCTGNATRSQLAEHLWRRRSDVPVASAGVAPADAVSAGAIGVAASHGIDLSAALPRRLDDVERPGDLRVTVCDRAHELLGTSDLHWSVTAPRSGDPTRRPGSCRSRPLRTEMYAACGPP